MQDIADAAGVSKCMVSLALSDKYGVNSDTKALIISTAIRLGYDFKRIRRNNKRSEESVTVFIRDEDLAAKRYWPLILRGVLKRVKELDLTLDTEVIGEGQDLDDLFTRVARARPMGIIIINYIPDDILARFSGLGIPIVLVDSRKNLGMEFDRVHVNNEAGSYYAAKLLKERGHRNICFIGNNEYSFSFNERYLGFMNAAMEFRNEINTHAIVGSPRGQDFVEILEGLGIYLHEDWGRERLFDVEETLNLIRRNGRGITAFLCANDMIADIVHRLCIISGKEVPRDYSVVGFDNIPSFGNDWVESKLTSVEVPVREMGVRATDLLMSRVANPKGIRETVMLNVRVIEKESVKNLNMEEG